MNFSTALLAHLLAAFVPRALPTEEISAIANAIVAIAALVGIPIALIQVRHLIRGRQEESRIKQQDSAKSLLNIYLKEYRTASMGRAIAALWLLYRKSKLNEDRLVRNYITLYKLQKNKSFHFDIRRKVSVFYQELALFIEKDKYAKDEVYSLWARTNLDLIPKVLMPIELKAIPRLLSEESGQETAYTSTLTEKALHSIKAMQKLYDNAPEY